MGGIVDELGSDSPETVFLFGSVCSRRVSFRRCGSDYFLVAGPVACKLIVIALVARARPVVARIDYGFCCWCRSAR